MTSVWHLWQTLLGCSGPIATSGAPGCSTYLLTAHSLWLISSFAGSPYLFLGVSIGVRCTNKILWTGWLKQQQFIFSHFWMLKSPQSGCGRVPFLLRALFPACKHCHFLCTHMTSCLCAHQEREREKSLSLLIRPPKLLRMRPYS